MNKFMVRVKLSFINPLARPSYYSNKKYLGKKVKDIGKPGLDKKEEYERIMKKILEDVKKGRISKRVARGRLLLLYRLTFPSKNKKARNLSKATRLSLRKKIKELMSQL